MLILYNILYKKANNIFNIYKISHETAIYVNFDLQILKCQKLILCLRFAPQ